MLEYVLTNTQYYQDIADAIRRKKAEGNKKLVSIAITTPPTKTSYNEGETLSLSGMVVMATYSDNSTKTVTGWTASPANGTTLNTSGTKTITISYTEKGVTKTTTTTATVNANLTSIAITTQPTKQTYAGGEPLSLTGMVITATYSDSSTKTVTGWTTSPANGSTLSNNGTTTITISYTENGITKTATTTVTVNSKILSTIAITTQPTKRAYSVGNTLNLSGMVVTGTYEDGTSGVIDNYTVSPTNGTQLSTNGRHYINVSVTQNNKTFKTDTFVLAGSSWTTATDSEIVSMVQSANAGNLNLHNEWNIGDERFVALPTMGEYLKTDPSTPLTSNYYPSQLVTLVLTHKAGHEYVTPTTARSKCWFEVQLTQSTAVTVKARYANEFSIGDDYLSNVNGWGATNRKTWCNQVFYNAIPSSIRSIFRQFKCKCLGGTGTIFTENVYFAYPAFVEICNDPNMTTYFSSDTPFYPTDNGYKDEGELWEYYQNITHLRLTAVDNPFNTDGSAWGGPWLLRTPYMKNNSTHSWMELRDITSESKPYIMHFDLTSGAGNLVFGVI